MLWVYVNDRWKRLGGDAHTGREQVPFVPSLPVILVSATFWVRFSGLKNCLEESESNIHLSFDLPMLHPYAGKNFEP